MRRMIYSDRLTREQYEKALRVQLFCLANGWSYHCSETDECTPDFSCCIPEMKDSDEKRMAYYRQAMKEGTH